MRRKIIEALLIIVCFILQCTVFQTLSLAGIVPNLLLIVTSSLGFMRGEKEGMAVGFFSGLLTDIFFGQLFGFYSLLYMFLGYGSGLFHRMFYDEDIKLPMVWIALSELTERLFFPVPFAEPVPVRILFCAHYSSGAGVYRRGDHCVLPGDPVAESLAGEEGKRGGGEQNHFSRDPL